MADVQREIAALASPIRREILWRIWRDELPAGEIAAGFDVTPPTISSHLRILREAGLVTTRVAGTFRYYRADRDALRRVRPLLDADPKRWEPATDLAPRAGTATSLATTVVVVVELPVSAADAFRALTEGLLFSRWMGVPVKIERDVLSAEMAWGTKVRGRYEHLVPPSFIHFAWTVDDDTIPTPGTDLDAYLQLTDGRVVVHQVAEDEQQAAFMDVAWRLVLGRLRDGVEDAVSRTG